MGQGTTVRISSDGLCVVTALAATSGGLQHTLLALAACHGGKAGPWLDRLEAKLIQDTKNIVFNGASMDKEAAAVEHALESLRAVMSNVRQRLDGART